MNGNEKLIIEEDVMMDLSFEDGVSQVNEELRPIVEQTLIQLGLNSVDNLKGLPREAFFKIFTPMLNTFYNL